MSSISDGSWLGTSACMERITQRSSTQRATLGKISETSIPLRQDLYALSGMLLKTWTMSDVRKEGDRFVPHRMRVEDKLQPGSYTEILIEASKFGVDLPEEVFTLRWLERVE